MKKKLILFTTSLAVLVGGATIIYGEGSIGSESDPIVTLKYVESRIEQVKYYIDQNLEIFKNENEELKKSISNANTNSNTNNQSGQGMATFKVIEVKAGQKLICGESTEVIWRAGKATTIGSELGGLTDVTDGKNLAQGQLVEKDHLIIVPRGDGRGMNVEIDSYVMIKGGYNIE